MNFSDISNAMNDFFEDSPKESNLEKYKEELNSEQYKAIINTEGPILIIAGAGTGKTRTLVYRLSYLIEKGVPPEQILLLTFTNKAANEMKERATKLLDDRCSKVESGTYHAFCSKLLRKYISKLGFKSNFIIMDTSDAAEAINLVKEKHGFSNTKEMSYPKGKELATIFSASVNKSKTIEQIIDEEYEEYIKYKSSIVRISEHYKEYKKAKNLLDYDDLLTITCELLKSQKDIREKLIKTYKYIMVDEYQDSNLIQLELLTLLTDDNRNNICVVGDPDQSIYGFRGSNYMNIINFPEQFIGCKTIVLDKNYRSNQEILNISNQIVNSIEKRVKKTLVSNKIKGSKPKIIKVDTTREEAKTVFFNIMQENKEGTQLKDIAVLIKNSSSSLELEALIVKESKRYNIPYVKYGGIRFMEKAHIKDILAFLKIISNPKDEVSWFRVLKLLPNIGNTYATRITENIIEYGMNVLLSDKYKGKKYSTQLSELYNILTKIADMEFTEQIETVVNGCYPKIMRKAINAKRISNINMLKELDQLEENIIESRLLLRMAEGYKSIESFINDITLDSTSDTENENKLTISTIHSAKGLEFKTVYILQCIEGLFPYINTDDNEEKLQEKLDEEKRVLYVALTRAKENLCIMCPNIVFRYGQPEQAEISRFLTDNDIMYNYSDIIQL